MQTTGVSKIQDVIQGIGQYHTISHMSMNPCKLKKTLKITSSYESKQIS